MSRISSLLAGLWFSLAVSAAAPVPVLLVLGDSLSAGYGIAADDAWPSLLQRKLDSVGQAVFVVNASISGETTRGALARLPALIDEHRPALVVIELGANDGLRGLPLDEFAANLQALVERSQAAGARVVVLPMEVPPNYGRPYSDGFRAVYAALPARFPDLALTPFFLRGVALEPALLQADGLHPTAAAQPRMLETVWPAIETSLHAVNGTTP
ncbi:MAG: arylesterase [Gammaproteobacteria bacterium]|nr:arylesterase [Gammaproteobacteria bacterium]